MVKVNHGHQNSVKATVLLPHIHNQVSLRYCHLLRPIQRLIAHGYITRPRFSTAQCSHSVCQPPAIGDEFRDGLGLARRRVYPVVPGSGLYFAEEPFGGPDQQFSELEDSDLSHVCVFVEWNGMGILPKGVGLREGVVLFRKRATGWRRTWWGGRGRSRLQRAMWVCLTWQKSLFQRVFHLKKARFQCFIVSWIFFFFNISTRVVIVSGGRPRVDPPDTIINGS